MKYRLRITVNVEDLEAGREAEPPTMYFYGDAVEIAFEADSLVQECINDLNNPDWCKEYDEL